MKQWNDAAFEAFFRVADSRPSYLNRSAKHAEVPDFAMSVAIDATPWTDLPFRLQPADELGHFLFE